MTLEDLAREMIAKADAHYRICHDKRTLMGIDPQNVKRICEGFLEMRKQLLALGSAAHNFHVEVRDWIHHPGDFLIAARKDLQHELDRLEKSLDKPCE